MSAVKRKLKTKTLVKKCEIIRKIENGMSNKEASDKFDVPKNTISTWMKNKQKLFEALEEVSSSSKKLRGCDYGEVDKAVLKWFSLQRSQNVPIDGPMLKEKALQFAEKFNLTAFKASDGWLDKWKKRLESTQGFTV